MNRGFVFYSSMWGARIVLYIGDKDRFLEYLKRCHGVNYDEPWSAGFCGLSFRMISPKDGHVKGYCIWMPEMNFSTDQYVTLAHECIHVACHILDDRGVVYSDEAKEVLTYTFDDIYGHFLKLLHEFHKGKTKGGEK